MLSFSFVLGEEGFELTGGNSIAQKGGFVKRGALSLPFHIQLDPCDRILLANGISNIGDVFF